MLFRLEEDSVEVARLQHHRRVLEILSLIQTTFGLGVLPEVLRYPLSLITAAHSRKEDISSIIDVTQIHDHAVRVKLLAAILRVADASDIDQRRGPRSIFELYEAGIPEPSRNHWTKHMNIAGLRYDSISSTILVYVIKPKGSLLDIIAEFELLEWIKNELQSELDSVASVFREYRVPLFHVQLIEQNGKPIDIEEPPRITNHCLITVDEVRLTEPKLAELEQSLSQRPGEFRVFLEIRAKSGARMFVNTGTDTALDRETLSRIQESLGNAFVAYETRTEQQASAPLFNR
jgi:hypothetical protein